MKSTGMSVNTGDSGPGNISAVLETEFNKNCHLFPTWQVTEKHRSRTSHHAERTDLFRDTNMVNKRINKTHERSVICVTDSGSVSANLPLLARQFILLLVPLCGKQIDPVQTCSSTFNSDTKLKKKTTYYMNT